MFNTRYVVHALHQDQCLTTLLQIWKVRLGAYEELTKAFQISASGDDPVFRPYRHADALRKMVTDSNVIAQEAALLTVTAFVEYASGSAHTHEAVVPAVVEKCLGATRAGTKNKAIDLILMYIQVDTPDPIVQEVLPGLDAKQPKLVAATVTTLKEVIRNYGAKTVNVKPILKTLPKIFGHSDKNVRAEGQQLAMELYRWLGQALQPHLADLKPVQVKELNEAFEKMPQEKPTQLRLLNSQQAIEASMEEVPDDTAEEEPVDAFDLAEPVDVLRKVPENFEEMLASSKWKERKEVLDALLAVVKTPRIKAGDFGNIISLLAKRMADANIMCVIAAANCLEALAAGLRHSFAPYKVIVVGPILEKLKERKQNVVDALAAALDAVAATVTLSDIIEDIVNATKHKNPQVKAESMRWLVRCLKNTKSAPNKAEIKTLADAMIAGLEDAFEPVRTAAAEGLGTLMKVVGERTMNPFMDGMDDLRKAKVKEFYDSAEVKYKPAAATVAKKAPGTSKAPVKKAVRGSAAPPPVSAFDKENDPPFGDPEPPQPIRKPVARPPPKAPTAAAATAATAARKPPAASSSAPPRKPAAPAKSAPAVKAAKDEPLRYKVSDEDVLSRAEEFVPAEIMADISNSNWKTRLAAMEALYEFLDTTVAPGDTEAELIVRFLGKRPGWKDSNFQVMTKSFNILQLLAERTPSFSKACVALSITPLTDKLGDIKMKKPAAETLMAYAEKTSLQFVLSSAYDPMSKQKAPKVQADALLWIHQAVTEFGIEGLSVRDLIEYLKNSPLKSSNAAVRTNAVTLLGLLRTYVGPDIRTFVQDLSALLLQTIDAEFEKVADQTPPEPTRVGAAVAAAPAGKAAGKASAAAASRDPMGDLFPRVDITTIVSAKIVSMCGDQNWKVRKEGLDEIVAQLEVNKRLKPNLGDIAAMLKARLADPNKPLQMLALDITARIANGMNSAFDKYVRILTSPVAAVLADQKAHVRAAAITTLDAIYSNCGLDHMTSTISSSLSSENPVLRKELLTWLAARLKQSKDDGSLPDQTPIVDPLLACLQDRNGDVRKAAQACLPFVIESAGFDYVMGKTSDLKGSSKSTVVPFIQAASGAAMSAAPAAGPTRGAPASRPTSMMRPPSRTVRDVPTPPPSEEPQGPAFKSQMLKRKIPGVGSGLRAPTARNSVIAPAVAAARPEENENTPPIITAEGRPKQMRANKEAGMPGKWLMDAVPSRMLIDSLAMQMEPHFSTNIHGQMFSKEHSADRDNLAAITTLDECINDLGYSQDHFSIAFEDFKIRVIANSDLLLKYITIHLYDTNTSMILKCLDLLEHLIALLDEESYHLLETEAAAFLPTLINKIGDPKEVIKTRAKGLLKSLSRIYPASKVFQYLMDHGLSNKNSRARAESLEELAALIQRHGLDVCQPAKVLPIVAKQIGDRDASVRGGAINVIVQAYIHLGDDVWKSIGKLSDKDSTLLSERLKRTSSSVSSPAAMQAQASGIRPPSRATTGITAPSPSSAKKLREPAVRSSIIGSKLVQPSRLSFKPRGAATSAIARPRQSAVPAAPSPPPEPLYSPPPAEETVADDNSSRPTSNAFSEDDPPHEDAANINGFDHQELEMDLITTEIISDDPVRSIDALKKIEKDLGSSPDHILPFADQIINAMTLQVRLAYTKLDAGNSSILRLCKHLVNALVLFFNNKELAQSVTPDSLHQLLSELAHRLLDPKLSDFESIAPLSKALNVTMVKVLENSDKNSSISALLSLLLSSAAELRNVDESNAAMKTKYTELIMKCLWKLARMTKESLATDQLQASQLLLDINNFFMDTAPAEWKRRASDNVPLGDMPLRTMKTLLSELVAYYGDSVYDHLDLVEDPHLSFVYPYLHHMLETKQRKGNGESNGNGDVNSPRTSVTSPIKAVPLGLQAASPAPASPSMHETEINNRLTEIFTKIGTREDTKQGIADLYEFQKMYPQSEHKITAQLAKTGTYFQSYIRRGLANIAAEEAERNPPDAQSPLASSHRERDSVQSLGSITSDDAVDPYKQKLLRLQQMFGYSRTGAGGAMSPPGSAASPPPIDVMSEGSEETEENGLRASQISGLKERLAMFKKTSEA